MEFINYQYGFTKKFTLIYIHSNLGIIILVIYWAQGIWNWVPLYRINLIILLLVS